MVRALYPVLRSGRSCLGSTVHILSLRLRPSIAFTNVTWTPGGIFLLQPSLRNWFPWPRVRHLQHSDSRPRNAVDVMDDQMATRRRKAGTPRATSVGPRQVQAYVQVGGLVGPDADAVLDVSGCRAWFFDFIARSDQRHNSLRRLCALPSVMGYRRRSRPVAGITSRALSASGSSTRSLRSGTRPPRPSWDRPRRRP
jgi:hypothetical protein